MPAPLRKTDIRERALLILEPPRSAGTEDAAACADAVWRWLGPSFIAKSWFNLDRVWAVSVLIGGVSLWAVAG